MTSTDSNLRAPQALSTHCIAHLCAAYTLTAHHLLEIEPLLCYKQSRLHSFLITLHHPTNPRSLHRGSNTTLLEINWCQHSLTQ